jgi:hypothetical protein
MRITLAYINLLFVANAAKRRKKGLEAEDKGQEARGKSIQYTVYSIQGIQYSGFEF